MEKRPYRDALSIDEAFNIIQNEISDSISREMFSKIKAHKKDINDLVLQCQSHTFEEYNLSI
jgi:HD-GYP domain-containing protein (c-di-GMP phosphodiesterase class II)